MKFFPRLLASLALLFSSAGISSAQMAGMDSSLMDTAMLKLFGVHSNFTATSEVRTLNPSQQELMSMSFPISFLDGKMRADMDLASVKSAMISPQMVAQMKQFGLDHSINIIRADQKKIYSVYPSLKAYLETPIPSSAKTNSAAESKLQKTVLGKETIDGHPCVKNKVMFMDDKGRQKDAILWNATDLKDFPVQMQIVEKNGTAIVLYKNVKFTKPDAKQFEPPAGYTKYQSQQELQQFLMQKMMESMQKKPQAK